VGVEAEKGVCLSGKRQRGVRDDAAPQNGIDVKQNLIFAIKGDSKMRPHARHLQYSNLRIKMKS
jgi:hypothetical protein